MADPPRRTDQAPPPARAEAAPPRAQTRPTDRPSTPRAAARSRPSGTVAPPTVGPSPTAAPPPENLRIEPVAASGNPESIAVEWRTIVLGSSHSKGCTVTATDGGALLAMVNQASYQRSFEGPGTVEIAAIPVAPEGTTGQLIVKHIATNATAAFVWQWTPMAVPGASRGDAPAPRGFWSRLFGGRKPPPEPRAAPPPEHNSAPAAEPAPSAAAVHATRAPIAAGPVKYATGARGTFFGQRATGRRFAFVLDFSGSMEGPRWETLLREVENAFSGLPPHAEYALIGFNSVSIEPPGQSGWTPLGPGRGANGRAWLAATRPCGGTYPLEAFERAFKLGAPPDTIFFVTDGQLAGFGVEDCLRLRGSSTTVIHTVALDQDRNEDRLQRMAEATGGAYTHVECPPATTDTPASRPPELGI